MGYNIISDIAGRFDELQLLLKKMPEDPVVSVGDMVDRGPKSKEVIEWFMKNGKAVLGNHEAMMLDACRHNNRYYYPGIWEYNGGAQTLNSFVPYKTDNVYKSVPQDVLDWIEKLPLYMELEGCLVSHAFLRPGLNLIDACDLGINSMDPKCDMSLIWNRSSPQRLDKYKLQLCGHNSNMGLKEFFDENGRYAICLDDSKKKKLTGMHIPSFTIYQVDYL